MNKIIVLQGLPGCGKSTVAAQLQAADKEHTVIVSRDALRQARGQYWIPEQEEYISRLEEHAVGSALEYGYNVIVDATNLNPLTIQKWTDYAKLYKVYIEFRLINTPLEECIARDQNPDRSHHVGEKVIRDFYKRYKSVFEHVNS